MIVLSAQAPQSTQRLQKCGPSTRTGTSRNRLSTQGRDASFLECSPSITAMANSFGHGDLIHFKIPCKQLLNTLRIVFSITLEYGLDGRRHTLFSSLARGLMPTRPCTL